MYSYRSLCSILRNTQRIAGTATLNLENETEPSKAYWNDWLPSDRSFNVQEFFYKFVKMWLVTWDRILGLCFWSEFSRVFALSEKRFFFLIPALLG
jgi:hypothetical protein